jgi:hypothetical protein
LKSPRAFLAPIVTRARPYAPALLVSAAIGAVAVRGILARTARPAVPLDDAFIHFQFARRFAEGHPFTFTDGGGSSSGATSFAWPLMLAPFHALGLRELSIVWAAWLLGALFHAATAVETARLATPLVGRGPGLAAGAMCALFAGFAWFAWSGMETIAFAWILVRAARLAAEWIERAPHERTARGALLGVGLAGFAAPLLRPEGALAAVIAAAALAAWPPAPAGSLDSRRDLRVARVALRATALLPLAGIALVPLVHLATTGHASSATTVVKWLVGNPYYEGGRLWSAVAANLQLMANDLMIGGAYTAVFLPRWSLVPIALGLPAAAWLARAERRPARAAIVVALALATMLVATYLTMLWNRVRYLWPFAPFWFVLVAAAASVAGRLAARFWREGAAATATVLAAIYAGMLADKLPWALDDLAQSAAAIDGQQVKLGLWAREALPPGARIDINDTGAIAYLSRHPTFDVVGLTTEGEARHWVAGACARFEHYERMPREALPTHFIVYPQWMALPVVLGRELQSATVVDQSILGGATKTAFEARWDALGTGALPTEEDAGAPLVAELDVGDLESEARAGYDLAAAWDTECQVLSASDPLRADGARLNRTVERFQVQLPAGAVRMTMRLAADAPTEVVVTAGAREVGRVAIAAGRWVERSVTLESPGGSVPIEVRAAPGEAPFAALHYWFFHAS